LTNGFAQVERQTSPFKIFRVVRVMELDLFICKAGTYYFTEVVSYHIIVYFVLKKKAIFILKTQCKRQTYKMVISYSP
jgi:hypothetical protein